MWRFSAAAWWAPTRRKMALGMGAHVTIIDRNLNRLRELDDIFNGQTLITLASNSLTIAETLQPARTW